ncbi:hypothetical protein B0A55_07314 [Friedmanniomyces simplex]|uniref:NADH dehydrogenase [ubiquinone] 1 beta subcomplex subunit 9 n=1 Tax=Friedmanniomyces simplex TaxID=329884 RepID=A0A4U0X3C0_9PEZI|nr:hypothetical protein B0A55_07314 [Friedmanniomyces simplex]
MAAKNEVLKLYRRSLKLALDWAIHRHLWRGQAVYIRSLFEANKHVTQPRQQRVCQHTQDRSDVVANAMSGTRRRDREHTTEVEAPRPIPAAYGSGRQQI